MKVKAAGKPKKKAVPLEEDARIVVGTLKGEAEIRAGLGKQFKNVDEFLELYEYWKKDNRIQIVYTQCVA